MYISESDYNSLCLSSQHNQMFNYNGFASIHISTFYDNLPWNENTLQGPLWVRKCCLLGTFCIILRIFFH